MSKKYLDNLIGKKIKEKLYGEEVDFIITSIKEEENKPTEWLDGSYTKEELLDIVDDLEEPYKEYKVYGKVKNIKKAKALQELSEKSYYQDMRGCSGGPFVRNDYRNEILLKIYKDGELPY